MFFHHKHCNQVGRVALKYFVKNTATRTRREPWTQDLSINRSMPQHRADNVSWHNNKKVARQHQVHVYKRQLYCMTVAIHALRSEDLASVSLPENATDQAIGLADVFRRVQVQPHCTSQVQVLVQVDTKF